MASRTHSTPPLQSGRHPKFRSTPPSPVLPLARSPRVLVIDDDAMVRRALVRGLQRKYAVTDLADAESALALIAGGARFDAILCDLNLTGMSGRDFFLCLDAKDEDQARRVVILTGSFTAGLFGDREPRFLEKPASMAMIDAALADLVSPDVRAA